MGIDRRGFLKIAGLGALGLAGMPASRLLGQQRRFDASGTEALRAGRWAMAVDLRKECPDGGCTTCIDACHTVHNVPKIDNPRHEIKWIWTEEFEHAFPDQEQEHLAEEFEERPVVVLCNHCENPPCVQVCPTKATFQRADGIVLMDFHRCIGCRFCMAACPFGSRSFNWRDPRPFVKDWEKNLAYPTRTKGVVEKCNFCAERLARGLIPACVEACGEKKLIFGDLQDRDSEIREVLRTNFTIRRKSHLGTQPQVYYIV